LKNQYHITTDTLFPKIKPEYLCKCNSEKADYKTKNAQRDWQGKRAYLLKCVVTMSSVTYTAMLHYGPDSPFHYTSFTLM